jgi:uncharacterized protein (TIGR02147 family)
MKLTIFDFVNYKAYLLDWIQSQPSRGHGIRRGIASSIGCQTAFVSQILKGDAHLSLEQADKLNVFLGHAQEEARFFLLLVQLTRAGTESLRSHFRIQMSEILEKRTQLRERLAVTNEISKEDRSIFFSSWSFAAAHVLLSIPGFQTRSALAQALSLSPKKVGNILDFLVSRGLAMQKGDQFTVGKVHIHLGNDSPMIAKHHMNWRVKALQSLDQEIPGEMHYSSVVSIAKSDAEKLHRLLVDSVAAARELVASSKEEELFAVCVDFFRVANTRKR